MQLLARWVYIRLVRSVNNMRAVNSPVTKGLGSDADVELQVGARCTPETAVLAEADTATVTIDTFPDQAK
jgi:hypothetical protein